MHIDVPYMNPKLRYNPMISLAATGRDEHKGGEEVEVGWGRHIISKSCNELPLPYRTYTWSLVPIHQLLWNEFREGGGGMQNVWGLQGRIWGGSNPPQYYESYPIQY